MPFPVGLAPSVDDGTRLADVLPGSRGRTGFVIKTSKGGFLPLIPMSQRGTAGVVCVTLHTLGRV